MWYHESVTFSVGATRMLTPCSLPSPAARSASDRAMKQSVSSGMCGPCCSVVPIGRSTASTPSLMRVSTSSQVMRSIRCSAIQAIFLECQTPCNTRPSMEGKVEVNGVNLWHQVTGEGEPVIQIHGAGFGHFNFAPATPELAKHFKVVDFDMRGYGQSDRPVQEYHMEVWADDVPAIDTIQQILRDSNRIEVFTAACQAMCDMDIRGWLPKITSPALVLGGDEDLMTPWDQGPDGAGQEAIFQGITGAEKHVIRGSNHSTIFDNTEEHNRVVIDFFERHSTS